MTHRTPYPILLVALSLASCQKPAPGNPLVGSKWSTTNMSQWPHPVGLKTSIDFGHDGHVRNYVTFKEGEECTNCDPATETTYTVSGSTLTFTLTGYQPMKYHYSITGGALTMKVLDAPENREFEGVTYTYEIKEK